MPNCKTLGKKYQSGNVQVDNSGLDSLYGCPQHITGNLSCGFNKLTTLVGGPDRVDGHYDCQNNQLTDLVGCASHIGGSLECSNNNITSLVGIHKIIKSWTAIFSDPDKITEGGIGLLLIENLVVMSTDNNEPFKIINKYLGTGTKGMMECSKELKAKGYSNYAKL